ncbi:LysR family transcriptional regulator [Vibrio metoecus]|uniref:LysR family transcriptional regulator n=1 Tax=Vibrio metoecus TaxID=1481663 RepID=UPI0001B99601|nr:LysR family transcriptional regulator [Vibrio metoecus]EEX64583.1 LysR-family transcriptional regulator [Vibrio metoecus]
MDYIHLTRFSLKHLTALHVMLNTRSVTQTAARLCVSPSSISKVLAQLRELLNDELFYRDGNQLIPTPYVQQMGPTVHQILSSMNGLLHCSEFNPTEYQGHYRLAMRESTLELFAPKITAILATCSSELSMTIHSKEHYGFDALQSGLIDFILLPHDLSQPPTFAQDLVWQVIASDELVCLMHPTHPLVNQELSVENYLAHKHIGILDNELSDPYFEKYLTQQHETRRIAVATPDFGAAAILCHQTQFLLTCSKMWADKAMQAQGLIQKSLPFEYGKVAYSLVWNKPSMNDRAIRWLCQQLLSSAV